MQIHELNNFTGQLGAGSYVAVDDGSDTGKLSTRGLLAGVETEILTLGDDLNARIDNIIAGGDAPSEAEIIDARYGANGRVYPSLGDAIRDQVIDIKDDLYDIREPKENLGYVTQFNGTKTAGGVTCEYIDESHLKIYGTATSWVRLNVLRGNEQIIAGTPTFTNNLPAGTYTLKADTDIAYVFYGTDWDSRTQWNNGTTEVFENDTMVWIATKTNSYNFGTSENPTIYNFELYSGEVSIIPTAIDNVARASINQIDEAFTKSLPLKSFIDGHYVNSSGQFVNSASDNVYIVAVKPGIDIVLKNVATGGNRCVVSYDADMDNPTDITPVHNYQQNTFIITPSSGAAYIAFTWTNTYNPAAYEYVNEFGALSGNVAESVNAEIDYRLYYPNNRFVNNLVSDGKPKTSILECYQNGVMSDSYYGQDATCYIIRKKIGKKAHISFDWQLASSIPLNSTNLIPFMDISNKAVRAGIYVRNLLYANNDLYRDSRVSNKSTNEAVVGKTFNGNFAFYVQYTGNGSNITMTIRDNDIVFKAGGVTFATVSYLSTDSIADLVADINDIPDIICVAVDPTNHTCADLCYRSDLSILLTTTFTNSLSETISDTPRLYVPYAWDKSWHHYECVIDNEAHKQYSAFDGQTLVSDIGSDINYIDKILIGAGSEDDTNLFNVRNLEINFEGWDDVEIVQSEAPPYSAVTQLISSKNPRLLIWEGHGVVAGSDADVVDNMDVSTERLMCVFDTLHNKGYVPVTWQEVIDWKINSKPLPKRCYVMMFDDFRYENYVDYDKRIPFNKFNVKAGLAIVSDNKAMDETMTINGNTYTVAQVVDIVKNAGWYPCSHTRNHRRLSDDKCSVLYDELKSDALSCDSHNIYDDIIVYPYGSYASRIRTVLEQSAFKLGVNVVVNGYNCKARYDMNLIRVEIGTRISLANALAPIV